MIPRYPEDLYSKKLQVDSSAISPTDEQCERILQNVLSATGHTDVSASYTDLLDTLQEIAERESRLRRRVMAGVVAAMLFLGAGVAMLLRQHIPPVDGVLIADDTIPLAEPPPSDLPSYSVGVYTADGAPAGHSLGSALRGLRREDEVLYFYFQCLADAQGWRATGAVSGEGQPVPPQAVWGDDTVVRYPIADDGLDIAAENTDGERVVVKVRIR